MLAITKAPGDWWIPCSEGVVKDLERLYHPFAGSYPREGMGHALRWVTTHLGPRRAGTQRVVKKIC